MPIEAASEIRVLNQEEFHALDRKLMGIVFEVHNQFGRLLDESLYKREVAGRWIKAGLGTAECESRITVAHDTFRKNYYIDVLFNRGLMLEAKVAESLGSSHRAQGLNYLFLTGLQHGRLVNFRPELVEHEFLSTHLTPEKRRSLTIVDHEWQAVNEESQFVRQKAEALVKDWGAFLEVGLYREALVHFLGGPERVIRPVPIQSGVRLLGHQPVHLITDDVAFACSSVTGDGNAMREHQRRFLKHTPLRVIQWINFNRNQIEFITLTK